MTDVAEEVMGEWTVAVLRRRDAFEPLFEGFNRMYAAMYVSTPPLLLPFFSERGYKEIDIMVGGSLAGHRDRLRNTDTGELDQLVSLVESGALTLYAPKNVVTLHGNLYLLYNDEGVVRVIHGSASIIGLTSNHQLNTVIWADFAKGDPRLAPHIKAYENHLTGTDSVFCELVAAVLDRPSGMLRSEAIEAWKARPPRESDAAGWWDERAPKASEP